MHLPTHLIPPRGFSVDPDRAPPDPPALLGTHTRYSHHTLDRRPAAMGLSGRKAKQRIGHDPRNLSWADGAHASLL
jgi:hypothetical protein